VANRNCEQEKSTNNVAFLMFCLAVFFAKTMMSTMTTLSMLGKGRVFCLIRESSSRAQLKDMDWMLPEKYISFVAEKNKQYPILQKVYSLYSSNGKIPIVFNNLKLSMLNPLLTYFTLFSYCAL